MGLNVSKMQAIEPWLKYSERFRNNSCTFGNIFNFETHECNTKCGPI